MPEDDRARNLDNNRQPEPPLVVLPPTLLPLSLERERRAIELLGELLADLLDDRLVDSHPSSPRPDIHRE
jgi:hypothetical protein